MSTAIAAASRRPPRATAPGMTIIELMVVLIVLAVIVTLAAPSMRGMMARQRVQSVQADLLTDLQLARSEVAQRSGTDTTVAMTFGGNADVSCYTVHVSGADCDCTRGAGSACTVTPAAEIKTTHLTRAAGVSVAASSPGGTRIEFEPPNGMVKPATVGMVIDVQDAVSGHLRTSISALGVPAVCSPDGSMRGVNPC
jgi:prepilin-type N-terminal cleavage/methylation domain-containing protein